MPKRAGTTSQVTRLAYAETHGQELSAADAVSKIGSLSADQRICIQIWDYSVGQNTWEFFDQESANTLRSYAHNSDRIRIWLITLAQRIEMQKLPQ